MGSLMSAFLNILGGIAGAFSEWVKGRNAVGVRKNAPEVVRNVAAKADAQAADVAEQNIARAIQTGKPQDLDKVRNDFSE